MNILVLGSGGREHALSWKIAQSPKVDRVFLHPGNAGTASAGFSFPLSLEASKLAQLTPGEEAKHIAERAKALEVSLVVIGPETYLAAGFADVLRENGLAVVGPGRAGAQLESSKIFAKEFMQRAGIPTASFFVVENEIEARAKVPAKFPVVMKLDGLAAGKGVVLPNNPSEWMEFCDRIWIREEFGPGPHRVVIEGFLTGKELSYMGFCDGKHFIPVAAATDYKRIYNGAQGPNTGGMGAVCPSPYLNDTIEKRIRERVIEPALKQFQIDNLDFRGILYAGLMIDAEGNPFVLEFNARFGDPETQAILMRLESDIVPLFEHTAAASLGHCPKPEWKNATSVYVVATAEGYPGKVKAGDKITGLQIVDADTPIFYSGVSALENGLGTAGGRVLGVGALAADAETARKKAYRALARIHWRGMHFRTDIGTQEEM